MSHSLTSHEDLTPYIESLMKISNQSASLERRRSFAADPEIIIKELLTELMNSRKNTQTTEEIAKKFLEAYNTSLEDQSRLKQKISSLSSDISDQNTLIQKYQKDIELKDSRYESITLEVIDMERALKQLNHECSQLKKERDFLKTEIQNKEQMKVVRENNLQQRKNLLNEVEKEKEKDKERESERVFQGKYEQQVIVNKKKQAEIDDLISRIQEIEALWQLDKNAADRLQKSIGGLRDELLQKKIEYDGIVMKYKECKERVVSLKEELMMQKAQNDSMMKENERQKSVNFKNEFEAYEEPSIKVEGFRRSRTEILSDYFNEFEETQNSEIVFTINSTDQSSPKFMLVNNKRTEVLPGISVFPQKARLELQKQRILNYKSKPELERSARVFIACKQDENKALGLSTDEKFKAKDEKVKLGLTVGEKLGIKHENAKLSLVNCDKFIIRSVLSIAKSEDLSFARVPVFTFDDAASEKTNSNETIDSRSRKLSTIETRDPIKEFFIFV